MTLKQTNGAEINAYGGRGVETFNQVESRLLDLVNETAEVLYNGRRAIDFKTTCTQNAVDFGTVCTDNMQSMSEVINDASSYVATNLGGDAINLDPPVVAITMPAIKADESIETADDGILRNLQSSCNTIYAAVAELYQDHLADFTSLGDTEAWVGPEYDAALDDVGRLTSLMLQGIEESKATMAQAIDKQLADLGM